MLIWMSMFEFRDDIQQAMDFSSHLVIRLDTL